MRERTRPPVHPGGILKRQYLEPLSIGVSQAALALGVSRKTLSKLIHERGELLRRWRCVSLVLSIPPQSCG